MAEIIQRVPPLTSVETNSVWQLGLFGFLFLLLFCGGGGGVLCEFISLNVEFLGKVISL